MPKHAGPDMAEIRDFLSNVLDRDTFHLCAINPKADKKTKSAARTILTKDIDEALNWVDKQDLDGWGVYFHVNFAKRGMRKKARREHMAWYDAVHVDCDPPEHDPDTFSLQDWQDDKIDELMNSKHIGPPSVIWISGYGVQALWLFHRPLKASDASTQAVEDVNRRLAFVFGGDRGAWDVSRVLRLPGTVNHPSAKKAAAGRKASHSRLVEATGETYGLDDFESLPAAPKPTSRHNPKRIDYTRYDYDPDYVPLDLDELARVRPDIFDRQEDGMAEGGNRSEVAYGFIRAVATQLMDEMGCSAADMLDDINVKKNLAHIVQDCGLEFTSHYEDQANPAGKIGLDIGKVLADMADDGASVTEMREARAEQRKTNAEARDKGMSDISVQEARRLFIDYVEHHASKHSLPNLTGGDAPGPRQLATEANVRQILQDCRVFLRWDVMRDEARVTVLPGKRSDKPSLWFERALANTNAIDRAEAEVSLIMDAIAQLGIVVREDVRKLLGPIARENYFHPMEDYATAVPWDGQRRIRELACKLNTAHPLAGRYMEIFFRQGVAVVKSLRRWMHTGEGEMLGSVLILNGPQNIGKTSFLNALIPPGMRSQVGGKALALGSNSERDSISRALSGVVCNLDEIEGTMLRSEHSALKNFTTETTDAYRLPYARKPIIKPRMTQLCGTANDLMLYDHTGSRRFLVIGVRSIEPLELTPEYLQQCYAEAWHDVFKQGATWWLDDDECKIQTQYNADHHVETDEQMAVSAYFNGVDSRYIDAWISSRDVAGLMGVKYTPQRWNIVKAALEANGCEYRDRVVYRKRLFRRVWSFPLLPERLASIEAGLRA